MRRSWPRGPTASSSCATAGSSTRPTRFQVRSRFSQRVIGDDGARSPTGAPRPSERRRRRAPRSDPLGRTNVPARMAPADPRGHAPHRGGRGCDREHHDRPQHGPWRRCRIRHGQYPAELRRLGSAGARRRIGRRPEVVRDDRRHRSPLGGRPRGRRDRGLPRAGSGRPVRRRAPRAPRRQLPQEPHRGRGHRRCGRAPAGRHRVVPDTRGAAVDGCRDRREPARAERGVRARLALLVDASEEAVDSFFGRGPNAQPALAGVQRRGNDFSDAPPLAMLSVATVSLLLASLVAAAGFAVVAQRRLRQLGMLAAIGATEKQLRLVLLANGAIVGAIAALVGVTVGLAAWVVFAPTLESAVDHRIDRLSLPWWLIATTIMLAIVGATAAAWWPGQAAARLPVMLALSGRPPRPRPARHAAIAAIALLAAGIACLALSDRERELLIIAGIVATILGCLLLGPLAIRIFSGLAGRVPIAPRLALRDLVRYQARSGAALAAVTLALGIAATVVVVASAEAADAANQPINLSDQQIRVYLGPRDARDLTPVDVPARLETLTTRVRQIAAQLDDATVVPLRKAYQPGATGPVLGDTAVYPPVE